MPLFDRPSLKVQKDRRVCRVTDTRIAKYSRRGMLLTLLAFFIASAIGELRNQYPQLLLAMGVGLILLTLLRGYFVFRFSNLYATGPYRWRRRYFIASTLGAAWWGGILLLHVVLEGFAPETHFLWLYTVIFCSSVASVFAPYHRFLIWFISVSLLPAAVAAMLGGEVLGLIYGTLTIAFVWLTAHQAQRESENYWDRQSAMQELQQRASSLAEARKHSEAAVELTNEFITNIGQEFRSQLADSLGALALLEAEKLPERQQEWVQLARNASNQQLKLVDNVGLFTRVARKDIRLRQAPFNLVKTIEKSFKFAAKIAHRQSLEFNFQIADNLPVMVTGDNRKTAQLIRNLVDSATAIAQRGELWGQVSFSPISGTEGQLSICLIDDGRGEILPDESELFGAFARLDTNQVTTGLGLSIAKGLAEAMGGYLQLNSSNEGNRYQVVVKFGIEPNQRVYLTPDRRLQDCEMLLLHQGGLYISGLLDTLNSFGMEATCTRWSPEDEQNLAKLLTKAAGRRQLVLLAPEMGSTEMLEALLPLLESIGDRESLPLVCLGTEIHREAMGEYCRLAPCTHFLARPATRKELHDTIVARLFGEGKKATRRVVSKAVKHRGERRLLLIEESRAHQGVTEEMLHALGYQVDVAASVDDALLLMPDNTYDLLLVDCQQNAEHSAEIIDRLRYWESEHRPGDRVAIIALTSTTEEQFEGRCLAAGMDDFLTKPLAKEPLRETLERWLGEVS